MKKLKTFKFTSTCYIEAESQEQAEEQFADTCMEDFAADADIEEVKE